MTDYCQEGHTLSFVIRALYPTRTHPEQMDTSVCISRALSCYMHPEYLK